jgi:tetratricopeptide (TPR) repeat protein
MGDHISAEEIGKFVTGRLRGAEAREVIRHMLADCPECQPGISAYGRLLFELDEGYEPAAVTSADPVYDAAMDRALATVLDRHLPRVEKEKAHVEWLLEKAAERTPGIQGLDIWQDVKKKDQLGWPSLEALLRLSAEARYRDRDEMLFFAMLANIDAINLKPAVYGAALVADLRARALGEYANAWRLKNSFRNAEQCLDQAMQLTEDGTGDLLIMARLIDIKASLRLDQRRLGEALERLGYLHDLYRVNGETHLAGRALISLGIATFYDGRPREAAEHVEKGLAEIDEKQEPQLAASARHNLIDYLAESGEYRKAGRLLLDSNLREAFANDPANLLRLRWVEGKIFAGRGRLDQAERAFLDVREGFLGRGEEYDASLIGLELSGVWLKQGKAREVKKLAEEIYESFRELTVYAEAIRAVRYFREACRREEATADLVDHVLTFIRQIDWHPQRKFAPS